MIFSILLQQYSRAGRDIVFHAGISLFRSSREPRPPQMRNNTSYNDSTKRSSRHAVLFMLNFLTESKMRHPPSRPINVITRRSFYFSHRLIKSRGFGLTSNVFQFEDVLDHVVVCCNQRQRRVNVTRVSSTKWRQISPVSHFIINERPGKSEYILIMFERLLFFHAREIWVKCVKLSRIKIDVLFSCRVLEISHCFIW